MYKVTNTSSTKRFLLRTWRFRYGIFYILDCRTISNGILRRKVLNLRLVTKRYNLLLEPKMKNQINFLKLVLTRSSENEVKTYWYIQKIDRIDMQITIHTSLQYGQYRLKKIINCWITIIKLLRALKFLLKIQNSNDLNIYVSVIYNNVVRTMLQ